MNDDSKGLGAAAWVFIIGALALLGFGAGAAIGALSALIAGYDIQIIRGSAIIYGEGAGMMVATWFCLNLLKDAVVNWSHRRRASNPTISPDP